MRRSGINQSCEAGRAEHIARPRNAQRAIVMIAFNTGHGFKIGAVAERAFVTLRIPESGKLE